MKNEYVTAEQPTALPMVRPPQRRILLVDDELDLVELMCDLLASRGYDVTCATNGAVALDLLRHDDFDLVITDLMMPVMDGIELVKAVREEPRLGNLPVIMMSAQIERGRAAVGDQVQGFLAKPFRPNAIIDAIHRTLRTN